MSVLVTGASSQSVHAICLDAMDQEWKRPEKAVLSQVRQISIHSVTSDIRPKVVNNCGALTKAVRCETQIPEAHARFRPLARMEDGILINSRLRSIRLI
jgi:dTDP-4-dehydrorhamnose reductase